MKEKILSVAEFAELIKERFAEHTSFRPIEIRRNGFRKVLVSGDRNLEIKGKKYYEMTAEEKRAAVEYVMTLKVDKITETLNKPRGRHQCNSLFVRGTYEKHIKEYPDIWVESYVITELYN